MVKIVELVCVCCTVCVKYTVNDAIITLDDERPEDPVSVFVECVCACISMFVCESVVYVSDNFFPQNTNNNDQKQKTGKVCVNTVLRL